MAKEIIADAAEQQSGMDYPIGGVAQFEAIVFKELPPTADFSCSETIVLPGQHTAGAAWTAVYEAVRAGGSEIIGGSIRPCVRQLAL